MGKKSRQRTRTDAAVPEGAVGPRQPCPCGSGRRHKACHGSAAGAPPTFVARPFAGLPGETDIVAMREFVPSATTPLTELIPRFRQMAAEAGRDPATLQINIGGQSGDIDLIKQYRDLNVDRVSTSLPSEKADTILPVLDRWAEIIRMVNG